MGDLKDKIDAEELGEKAEGVIGKIKGLFHKD